VASDWNNDPDSVLRGAWGALVAAAADGRSASNMWNALKDAAYSQAASILNVTSAEPPSEEDIQAAASNLIGHVTIQDMNRYSSLAGQYLSSKANLEQLGRDNQITGTAVFNAPWSTTASNPAIPTRYRLRVLRDITFSGFSQVQRQEWATYELGGVLTTAGDALTTADALFNQADYNSRASINAILDYSIETV
jgi:hypothetical protein